MSRILPLLLLASLPAAAHDTWLTLAGPKSAEGARVGLLLTTGDAYPERGTGVAPTRLARAEILTTDRRLSLAAGLPRDDALPMEALAGGAPFLVAIATLKPWRIELEEASVAAYLVELGNDPKVAERHARLGRWRESYRKNAKALIRRSGREPSVLATKAHGLPYELVPTRDPTLLTSGEVFTVCAHADGKPVGPVHVGLVDADGSASWRWSGADGCTEVAPRGAHFLLRSIRLRESEQRDVEWDSDFAALTVFRAATQGAP